MKITRVHVINGLLYLVVMGVCFGLLWFFQTPN